MEYKQCWHRNLFHCLLYPPKRQNRREEPASLGYANSRLRRTPTLSSYGRRELPK
jgi:hypothetical protein